MEANYYDLLNLKRTVERIDDNLSRLETKLEDLFERVRDLEASNDKR